jgi:hypothetical protein
VPRPFLVCAIRSCVPRTAYRGPRPRPERRQVRGRYFSMSLLCY